MNCISANFSTQLLSFFSKYSCLLIDSRISWPKIYDVHVQSKVTQSLACLLFLARPANVAVINAQLLILRAILAEGSHKS